jgi:hypothetical protein
MNRTHAREGITCLPSCLDLSHIVTLEPVHRCVPVYSAVTRPSGGLAFGAGQGRLDTVWTGVGWVLVNSYQGVPLWGLAAATHRRKDLVNLFHFSSGPTRKPQQGSSTRQELSIHLRRLRRPFPVHPGGCQPHLIKEVTSCFRVDRRRDDHFFG